MNWLCLAGAILAEVVGTSAMKLSDGFTKPGPTLATLACYGLAFWLLSLTLRTIPVGVAYAVWSGVGIVLISAIGVLAFDQPLDRPALAGIGLILAGVVVLNVFSAAAPH